MKAKPIPRRVGQPFQVRYLFWILFNIAILLAVVNSFRNPLFESPDELLHYQFVRYLIDKGSLPAQPPGSTELTQYHQPPLYYLGGALLTASIEDAENIPSRNPHWTSYKTYQIHRDNKAQFLPSTDLSSPFRGTAFVVLTLRLWSILLVTGTLVVTWKLGKELWPNDNRKQLLLFAIVAFNPMFLYIGSSANNDNMVVFLGSLLLLLTVIALRNTFTWPTTLLIGMVWGAAVLSKFSGLLLGLPWVTGLIFVSWQRRSWQFLLSRAAAIGGIALVVSGWWFARNLRLYQELSGIDQMLDIWGRRESGEFGLLALRDAITYSWSSFWGRFGYGQIVLPTIVYWFYTGLALAGLLGMLWLLFGKRPRRRLSGSELVLVAVVASFAAGLGYFFYQNPSGANGRYTYPAILAFAALIVIGLSAMKWPRWFVPAVITLLVASAVFSLGWLIPWTYAQPQMLDEEEVLAQLSTTQDLTWGNSIRLLGSAIQPDALVSDAESEFKLKVCWRAEGLIERDYTFFVHLLDHDMNPMGGRNMHPGLGNYPTSTWQPGDVFCDNINIPVMVTEIEQPTLAAVEIGFYDTSPDDRLPARSGANQVLDFVIVDRVKILPAAPGPAPEPTHVLESIHFAQGVDLVGYDWSIETSTPGEQATLTLWWDASGPLDADYTVFAHLLNEKGEIIVQADGKPRSGQYFTDFWGEEIIVDSHTFDIPDDKSVDPSKVQLGFYRLDNGVRLLRASGSATLDYVELPGPEKNK